MPSMVTRYEVDAQVTGPGVSTASCNHASLEFDSSAGHSPTLFGPAELLAAALSACVLKNVERFSQILRFGYHSARVHVTAERHDRPSRIVRLRYVLHVVTDEPPHRVELLHRNIQRHGTITNTLAAACDVTGEIIAERPAVRASEEGR